MDKEIPDYGKLRVWLQDKPREWAQIIAIRAALRALPKIGWLENDDRLHISVFRAIATSWAARKFPAYDLATFADAAHKGAFASVDVDYSSDDDLEVAAKLAAQAAYTAAAAISHDDAAACAASVASAADGGAYLASWGEVSHDFASLEQGSSLTDMLTRQPLWRGIVPSILQQAWHRMAQDMVTRDPNAWVWREWYDRRLGGADRSFGHHPADDEAITLRLVGQPEAFWNRSFPEVNAEIAKWVEDASRDAFRKSAAEVASPDVVLVEDQFDAMPNPRIDAPDSSQTFEEALAKALGLAETLVKSIGDNAHRPMRVCAKFYAAHLREYGLRPIMGLLDDWIAALQDARDGTPRDEWEPGQKKLADLLIERHEDLKRLFPNFEEREKLAETVQFASGGAAAAALADALRKACEAVGLLAEEGLTTPAFEAAAAQQAERAAEVPPPPAGESRRPGPSRLQRIVTQAIGFYEKTVSLLGSTAKLADSQAAQAAAEKLKWVVDKLMDLLNF